MLNTRFKRYLATVFIFLAVLGFQIFINSFLDLPLIGFLYPSAFLTAYFLGMGPGIVFVLLSMVGSTIFFAPPFGPPLGDAHYVRFLIYGFTSMGMAYLIQRERKSRQALNTLEERFRRSSSAVDLGTWYSDIPTGKIIWNKQARRHLFVDPDVEGSLDVMMERVHPDDRHIVQTAAMEAITKNIPYDASYRTVNPKDPKDIKHIHAMGWVDYGPSGEPLRFDGICFDETHLHRISEELKEAVKLRDEFLSISSHELKTPLTSLEMQLQLFAHIVENDEGPIPRERVEKVVEVSKRQMGRLNSLVEDLLDATRISSGKLTLNFGPVDLCELVHEVIERYAPLIRQHQCELELHIPESVVAQVDRLRFEQILTNLLSNATKYAPRGQVKVILEEKGENIQLVVSDNGPGIRPEDQPRIFKRFERLSSQEGKGLGLGLFIVKNIVEAHEGSITLTSETGKGTSFAVQIPKR